MPSLSFAPRPIRRRRNVWPPWRLRPDWRPALRCLPGATSYYVWQGQLEQSSEVQMLLKCDSDHQQALFDLLRQAHPYDVPELLALPVQHGDSEYLSWLHASLA